MKGIELGDADFTNLDNLPEEFTKYGLIMNIRLAQVGDGIYYRCSTRSDGRSPREGYGKIEKIGTKYLFVRLDKIQCNSDYYAIPKDTLKIGSLGDWRIHIYTSKQEYENQREKTKIIKDIRSFDYEALSLETLKDLYNMLEVI